MRDGVMRTRLLIFEISGMFSLPAASAITSTPSNKPQHMRTLGEITALGRLGLAANAPSPLPSPSSGSSISSGDAAPERMPIDAQAFAEDERSSSESRSGSGSGSGSGSAATVKIPFIAKTNGSATSNRTNGSSSDSASGSEDGGGDVEFPSSTSRSNSASGSNSNLGEEAGVSNSTVASGGSGSYSGSNHTIAANSSIANSSSSSGNSGSGSGSTVVLFSNANAANALKSEFASVEEPQAITSTTPKPTTTLSNSSSPAPSSTVVDDGDDSDEDLPDEPATTAPQMHGVPSNPTHVAAVAHDGRAEVSWEAPDDDGADPITEYEVSWFDEEDSALVGTQVVAQIASSFTPVSKKKKSSDSGSTSSVGSAAAQLPPTTTVVSHLLNGKSYTFKVRAKNVNGFSVWSAKSLAVSPLHPPDLCGRISCSGRGTCFPNYQQQPNRLLTRAAAGAADVDASSTYLDAQCICRHGYSPPDCSVKSDKAQQYVWKVGEWSGCSSGCGGGKRTRDATCVDTTTEKAAESETLCIEKKPSLTGICNGMECGSKLVSVKYEVEMSYDEVLFSAESVDAFELAFTTEVSAALQIPRTRLEITALKRGSIAVFFNILPASRVGEKSLNDIVEKLQDELNNATSTLRSKGTFARRVEPNGVKMSFSLADQSVQGGAEDISILGLIGTVLVLCFFVFMFGWSLRKRHQRILKQEALASEQGDSERVLKAPRSELKRMGIRTMA